MSRRELAGRIRLGSPLAAAFVSACVCLVAAWNELRWPAAYGVSVVVVVFDGVLAVAGTVTASLIAPGARTRVAATFDGLALGLLGYFFSLIALWSIGAIIAGLLLLWTY